MSSKAKPKDPLQDVDETVPGFLPDPSTYMEPTPGGKRRARTFSQAIADATRGVDAGMNRFTPQVPDLNSSAYKPDWRGHYKKPSNMPAPRASLDLETEPADEIHPLTVAERLRMGKFDPSEARDDHGRWSAGGGGKGSAGKPTPRSRNKVIFYHGTAASAVASITKEGLIPHAGKGGDLWAAEHWKTYDLQVALAGQRKVSVYITPEKSTAAAFAELAADENKSEPAIFRVEIPKTEANHLVRDERANQDEMEAWRYEGKIKPEWIRPVSKNEVQAALQQAREHGNTFINLVKVDAPRAFYIVVPCDGGGDTLYSHRPVLNAQQLHDWATTAGIPNLVPPHEMHVTTIYSRTPVDIAPRTDTVIAKRKIAPLGDKGAIVLHFNSPKLQEQHREAMAAGASHDWPSFLTHVTLSYDAGGKDFSDLEPPDFPLEFGPEVHAPINDGWAEDKGLRKYSPDQERDDQGRWTSEGTVGNADEKRAQIKTLREQTRALREKGNLTAAEAREYQQKTSQADALRYDIAKPMNPDKIADMAASKNSMGNDAILAADRDIHRRKPIYMAIKSAAQGVAFNKNTAVDDIMLGHNADVSPQAFYDNFSGTRAALQRQYGDSLTLYRSEGQQMAKPTQNWATTREFAAQFGDHVVSKDIPVANVLAVHVGASNRYHEIIVGTPPVGKYDPSEPRDDQGQWTDAGGGSEISATITAREGKGKTLFVGPADVTNGESDAMRDYTGGGFEAMNQRLGMMSVPPKLDPATTTSRIDRHIALMDQAMQKFTANQDFVVWRLGRDWERVGWDKVPVGKELKFKTFLSTSMRESVTGNFGSDLGGALTDTHYHIMVPKGAHMLPVAALDASSTESEITLPRNSKFAVDKIDKSDHAVWLRMVV